MLMGELSNKAGPPATLALLQWTGFWSLLWPWLARANLFRQLGIAATAALGLTIGLLANFQVFFFGVVGWGVGASHTIILLSAAVLIFGAWAALAFTGRPVEQASSFSLPGGRIDVLGLFGLAVALIWCVTQMQQGIPGVFDKWDAVVSWNRWATEWFESRTPIYTMGYPQLVPTALAMLYAWMGVTDVQPVARVFMLLFVFTPCFLFWDGYRRWRMNAFLWGGAIWLLSLTQVFPGLADSGYADVPGACFVAITGYFLLLGVTDQIDARSSIVLGAIAAAAAVLTKQPAGIAWLIWLVLACKLWFSQPQLRAAVVRAAALFLLLAAPWFFYTAWRIHLGLDVTNISYLVNTIHAGRGFPERIFRALEGPLMDALAGFGSASVAAACIAVILVFACTHRWGRWLVLGICLPYTVLWAVLFSYDARNLLPALGPVSLGLGIGISRGLYFIRPRRSPLPSEAVRTPAESFTLRMWLPAVLTFGFLTIAALVPVDIAQIVRRQDQLQRIAENPNLNRRLLDYARSPGFDRLVVSIYTPMLMIDGLRQHVVPVTHDPNVNVPVFSALMEGRRPLCDILSLAPQIYADVGYLMLHRGFFDSTINAALAGGTLRLEFEMDGWLLMKIRC